MSALEHMLKQHLLSYHVTLLTGTKLLLRYFNTTLRISYILLLTEVSHDEGH